MHVISISSIKKELRFCNINRVDLPGVSSVYLEIVRQCRSKSNANICVGGLGGAKSISIAK